MTGVKKEQLAGVFTFLPIEDAYRGPGCLHNLESVFESRLRACASRR